MEQQKILEYKDAPEKFEEVKNSLLGDMIKVVGRVNKNELFDRLEFIARLVFKADPKEEIERLKKEAEKTKVEEPVAAKSPTAETVSESQKEDPGKLPSVEEI